MEIINFSFSASIFVLVIITIRMIFINRFPKIFFRLLWTMTLIKLFIPVKIPFPLCIYNLFGLSESKNSVLFTSGIQYFQDNRSISDITLESLFADTTSNSTQISIGWINIITLSVSITILVFVFTNHLIYRRRYGVSLPCSEKHVNEWVKSHKLRRRYSVRMLEIITTPMTYGIIKPVILLPSHIDINDKKQTEFILIHEYIHIKQFDVLWKSAYLVMVAVHWFNPIVWIAYILMDRDLELSCDEAVITRVGCEYKKAYAEAIVNLASKNKKILLYLMGLVKI